MSNEEALTPTTHQAVLIDEVIHYLHSKPGGCYLDVTFGSGGHSRAILRNDPKARVVALDWDRISLDQYAPALKQEFGERFTPIWGNFAHLYKLVKKYKLGLFDGILADFGTSYMQIWDREGFSVYRDTPLDMRMSPGHQLDTAATILRQASQQELSAIFWHLAQEPQANKIAKKIVEIRAKKPIETTGQLVALIESIIPSAGKRVHPATKVFQALRMAVNKELENIEAFLPAAIKQLAPSGRLVCITFHSLEDRLVKSFFKEKEQEGIGQLVTKSGVRATQEELARNRSARSATLRAFARKAL